MARIIIAAVAVVIWLAGCDVVPPPDGGAVRILTGPSGGGFPGCFTFSARGELVVDPVYGTAIINEEDQTTPAGVRPRPVTVAWRPGFTARRLGSEVEVIDPRGDVVAITGRTYVIDGGYVSAGGSSGMIWPELPIDVFWACDRVTGAIRQASLTN